MKNLLPLLLMLFLSCERVQETEIHEVIKKSCIPEHTKTEYPSEYCFWCGEYIMVPEMHPKHMLLHNPKKITKTVQAVYIVTLDSHESIEVTKEQWESKNLGDTIHVVKYRFK